MGSHHNLSGKPNRAGMEFREALAKRDIPYITVRGTRGDSNLAAAVNALMKLAAG